MHRATGPDPRPGGGRSRPGRGRRLVWAALAAVTVGVLVGAVLAFTAGGRDGDAVDGPVDVAALKRFYEQRLSWRGCAEFAITSGDRTTFADPVYDCAFLQVPLDYAKPDGRAAQVAVLRHKAADQSERLGSLVINPGGPGVSGNQWVVNLLGPELAGKPLGEVFDIVGFDPRGSGASRPAIRCFTPQEFDAERLDTDVDLSPDGVARSEAEEQAYAAKCAERSGGPEVLANVGTRDAIRDLDILRAALGEAKLTYLGYGGSALGHGYAEKYPGNVRAMVLDGAVDPNEPYIDSLVNQWRGFQSAFDSFSAWCAQQAECPLGTDPAAATERYRTLVLPLVDDPLPVPDGRRLSYSDAQAATTNNLYSSTSWNDLREALAGLARGDGAALMQAADASYERRPDGGYTFGSDAFQVISCVDDVPLTDPDAVREASRRINQVAPWRDDGRGPSPVRGACAFWPVPNTSTPHTPKVTGLPQVLVIAVTGAPAVPYQAGANLAAALNARLLTVDGNENNAALTGTPCVDDIVTRYLVDPAALPPDGTRCVLPPK